MCPLQSASLALTTTPSEDIALALRSLLRPLAWIGVPVQYITLTVLLALRFLALVLEEGRNLALGLAMRGIDWRSMGPGSGILVRALLHELSIAGPVCTAASCALWHLLQVTSQQALNVPPKTGSALWSNDMQVRCTAVRTLWQHSNQQRLKEGQSTSLGTASSTEERTAAQVVLRLLGRLFDNLLRKSGDIAVALHARGYINANSHAIYTGTSRSSSLVNNVVCGAAIVVLITQAALLR